MNRASTTASGSCLSTSSPHLGERGGLAVGGPPGTARGGTARRARARCRSSASWLPITASSRTGSSPAATRPSRSCRQCASLLTSSTARLGTPVSVTVQRRLPTPQLRGDLGEPSPQLVDIERQRVGAHHLAGEEPAAVDVGVVAGLDDPAPGVGEETRDAGDDARGVRAAQRDDVAALAGHARILAGRALTLRPEPADGERRLRLQQPTHLPGDDLLDLPAEQRHPHLDVACTSNSLPVPLSASRIVPDADAGTPAIAHVDVAGVRARARPAAAPRCAGWTGRPASPCRRSAAGPSPTAPA